MAVQRFLPRVPSPYISYVRRNLTITVIINGVWAIQAQTAIEEEEEEEEDYYC